MKILYAVTYWVSDGGGGVLNGSYVNESWRIVWDDDQVEEDDDGA